MLSVTILLSTLRVKIYTVPGLGHMLYKSPISHQRAATSLHSVIPASCAFEILSRVILVYCMAQAIQIWCMGTSIEDGECGIPNIGHCNLHFDGIFSFLYCVFLSCTAWPRLKKVDI